jgi:hypothetical protein
MVHDESTGPAEKREREPLAGGRRVGRGVNMTGSGVGYKEKRPGTNGLDHKCSTGRGSQMTRWDLWPRNKPLPQVTVKFGDRAFRSGPTRDQLTWVAKIITQKRSCARSPRQSEKSPPPSLSPFPLLGASGHARHKSIAISNYWR